MAVKENPAGADKENSAPTNVAPKDEGEDKPAKEGPAVVGVSKERTKDGAKTDLKRFGDFGEKGFYEGELVGEPGEEKRHGQGVMIFDSGNRYEGGFVDNKFHGEKGVYRWHDGDVHECPWVDGERHGPSVFRSAEGNVEYSAYERGRVAGEGVQWSADRRVAYKMMDGRKTSKISAGMAEKLAKDKFGLPVPEPFEGVTSSPDSEAEAPSASKDIGFFRRLFSASQVGSDGTLLFKDYGMWGTYEGDVDSDGLRQGRGKMIYDTGGSYEGGFVDSKFEGDKGVFRWSGVAFHDGSWKGGERHGKGSYTSDDGTVEMNVYEAGVTKGDGLAWVPDRKTAHKMSGGKNTIEVSLAMAEELAMRDFGLPVPEPAATAPPKDVGLFGSMFSNKKVGSDGKMRFKDNGEWGTYEGDLDASGNRTGQGKMTYEAGNWYEGPFVDDKFHGEKGVYRWSDDEEYEGGWAGGQRDGAGIFRSADGTADYSTYAKESQVGEGVTWSPDRKTAHKTLAGVKQNEISAGMAEKLARDVFDLPVPAPAEATAAPPETTAVPAPSGSKSTGFFGSFFSKSKVGPDGKMMFKDSGEWGSYDGEVDADGNRTGSGKMTYVGGHIFEGDFVNDKFHGDGVYLWVDGDKYDGSWKDGERHGKGSFRTDDGTVEYSMYDNGQAKGDGVWWSPDRKSAQTMLNGERKMEILVDEATSLSKEKFDLPVPEILTTAEVSTAALPSPATAPAAAPAAETRPGFFSRLFSSGVEGVPGPDGKLQFKDYGDWGSYDGELDATGKRRQGSGEMKYNSGNSYKGGFVDNKFHADKGVYHWVDGDEYDGSWAEGERHGVGVFTSADHVEYSTHEKGAQVGDGLKWSADRKSAYKTLNGATKGEISLPMAEKMAKEMFDLPVPELSEVSPSQSASTPLQDNTGAGPSVTKGPRFEDFGDMGTYDGELVNELRQGEGKMFYDSGNMYEGDFSKGKFNGYRGLYRWSDGTEYEGSWKEGCFDGIGIFRWADGSIDYAAYKDGYATGVGLFWNFGFAKAYLTLDGVKMSETSLAAAEKLGNDKFGLPAPSYKIQLGIGASLGRLFKSKVIGQDGEPIFNDYGTWGSYKGGFDASGNRHGEGKMIYECGHYYEGGFVEDKFHGDKGLYHWSDGDEYEGAWEDGERHGFGIFTLADGSVKYTMFDKGSPTGEGISWSADRKSATKLLPEDKQIEVSLAVAEKMARDKFDRPVPEPSKVSSEATPVPKSIKSAGFLGSLFSNRKIGADGNLHFKDNGEWGSYEGGVDEAGNRQGKGKITYTDGNYYDGKFVDDKYNCDEGTYHWLDGDEYVGEWKDGERNGKGCFKNSNGSVDYAVFERGEAKGEGVRLSSDRKTAHVLLDGETKLEILIEEAELMVKEKFQFATKQ